MGAWTLVEYADKKSSFQALVERWEVCLTLVPILVWHSVREMLGDSSTIWRKSD